MSNPLAGNVMESEAEPKANRQRRYGERRRLMGVTGKANSMFQILASNQAERKPKELQMSALVFHFLNLFSRSVTQGKADVSRKVSGKGGVKEERKVEQRANFIDFVLFLIADCK